MSKDDFAPVPGSETMFFCSGGRCDIEHRAPDVFRLADDRRHAWARAYHREHGEYPDIEAQSDFMERVLDEEEEAARRREMLVAPREES